MKRLLMVQNGFSLLQGMLLAAALAGSALVATQMLSDQKLTSKGSETREEVEALHKLIYTALQDKSNCTASLVAADLVNLMGGNSENISEIVRGGGDVFRTFSPGTNYIYMNGSVTIESIRVHYANSVTPALPSGMGRIDVTYQRLNSADSSKRTKKGYGAKDLRKSINIRVQRDPLVAGTPFVSCYAVTADKTSENSTEEGNDIVRELCLEMNVDPTKPLMIWDEANSTCLPNGQCPNHLIFTGFDSNGGVKCREAKDWINFERMIDPTTGNCDPGQIARIHVVSTNPVKVRISCETVVTCYVDSDGDGYGTGGPISMSSCGAGYSATPGDCCDSDPSTFPGAYSSSSWPSVANACGSFDYNCDSVIEKDEFNCQNVTSYSVSGPSCVTACGTHTFSTITATGSTWADCGTTNTLFKHVATVRRINTCGQIGMVGSGSENFCEPNGGTSNGGGFSTHSMTSYTNRTCKCR